MESKTTSKTGCLKALLLRAWRERWSDLQWGINLKTVLPRGVSGDVYDLADCILQQAVVGSGANQLVLSYLKHSLSAQLVSHAAVLQRLAKFQQLHKTHCVASLLDFLEGILPGVTCCGKSEGTKLATALLSTAYWLLQVVQSQQLFDKAVTVLRTLFACPFYLAMLCLAKHVEPDLYVDVCKKCTELENKQNEEVTECVRMLLKMDPDVLNPPASEDNGPGCLVQGWLAVQLVGSPGSSTMQLVQRLRLLQRLKNYSDVRLYAEIMRGSMLSLHDVRQTPYESQWGAFTFLKVPHILSALADKSDTISVYSAVNVLLQHSPLLDAMDAYCSCSNLDCLLGELTKVQLLTEQQTQQLSARRETPVCVKLEMSPSTTAIPKIMISAELTLMGILKTLTTETHKIQDALLGMLHQVLSGKSFELILAVATINGQLKALVARLVRFNEFSKLAGDKGRAQLFDISFLMVVAIVQRHGATAVLDGGDSSLLEQWIMNCMVEAYRPKAPEQLLKLCDPTNVDALLQQFNAGEADFSSANIKWHDILFNMPGVMREVLVAWEQGALAPADVKRILDSVRSRMCCLPLAAAAWLCAYMRTAPHDTLLKPVNMVQQLLSPPNSEDECLRERWQLMCEIIRKMQRDVQLPLQPSSGRHLVSRLPAAEQLNGIWKTAVVRGWLDRSSARTLHCLLDTAGARWLVSAVLQELLKLRYRDLLDRGVDLALAMFHVDIRACALQLLSNSLPQILHNSLQADSLVEPQLSALARLSSHCVYSACCCPTVADENPEEVPIKRQKIDLQDEQVLNALCQLLTTLETSMYDGQITQKTYFTFHLLRSIVEVRSSHSGIVLSAIPSTLGSQLLKTLPELFTPGLLLNLHDLLTPQGRTLAAKDLCVLRNYQLRNT